MKSSFLPLLIPAASGGAPALPSAVATRYDGVADYFKRSGSLAGSPPVAANGVVISGWLKAGLKLGDGSTLNIIGGPPSSLYLDLFVYDDSGTGKLRFGLESTLGTGPQIYTDIGIDAADLSLEWHYFLIAQDFQSGVAQFYFDDAPFVDTDGYSSATDVPFTFDASATHDWTVGALSGFSGFFMFAGCLSQTWLNFVDAVPDFSVVANRRKFITSGLRPADLGADGSAPFGTPPLVYLPAGDGTNKGTGGDLDEVFGAPSECSTNPADDTYSASATHYDGVGDYQERGGALAGAPAAVTGIVGSFFVNPEMALNDGSNLNILQIGKQHLDSGGTPVAPFFNINLYDDGANSGKIHFDVDGSDTGTPFVLYDVGLPLSFPVAGFSSFIFTVDFQTGVGTVYCNDVVATDTDSYSQASGVPFTVDATAALETRLAALRFMLDPSTDVVGAFFKGCISELWVNLVTGALPDLSIESNRRKFISADGKPVDLGLDGSKPFGTAPIFYSPLGDGENRGTGGNLDTFGAPSRCVTNP